MSLESLVSAAYADRSLLADPAHRVAVFDTLAALDRGEVRVATRDDDGSWRVHAWLKEAILLYFALREMERIEVGPFEFRDKIPMKKDLEQAGIRVVPPGVARYGAFLEPGVVLMPGYVNLGAWVGPGTLIDSHALVGSCAQVGARVHVSAAAQIGGVIEPVGAMPVIVEDDVLVGGNTGIYEGAVIKARAVIAAGTVLTGSTPVYDLVHERIIAPVAGEPLIVPEGAVVVPGARAVSVGAGREWGVSLATPVIVKYRDAKTDTRTELERWIR